MTETQKNRETFPDSENMRKLAVVMFIDIVGYSRMMSQDEEETLKILHDFSSILEPIINKYEGNILKRIGDGLFCEFSTALKSVKSGLAIHQALEVYNREAGNKFNIKVRIGIHLGDVVQEGGDLLGDGVNVAARIEKICRPGGICVSESIFSALGGHSQFQIVSLGHQPLKNIKYAPHLYQILTGHEVKSGDPPESIAQKESKKSRDKNPKPVKKNRFLLIVITGILLIAGYYTADKLLFDNSISKTTEEEDRLTLTKNEIEIVNQIKQFHAMSELSYFLKHLDEQDIIRLGTRKDFQENKENKLVVITDEFNIYTTLKFQNGKFYDVIDFLDRGNIIKKDNSSEFFSNVNTNKKIEFWMEVF